LKIAFVLSHTEM